MFAKTGAGARRLVRRTLVPALLALALPAQILAAPAPPAAAQDAPPAVPAAAQVVGVSTEAEAGTLSGPVSVAAADGTSYVQFGVPQADPPPPSTAFQPAAPYYGTFYYSWFKNAAVDGHWGTWNSGANQPSDTWFSHYLPDPNPAAFDPWNELYSARNPATIYWQLRKMAEARMEFAVSSWWGPGKVTDENFRLIITDLMNRADNPYPNLRWSLYYEEESEGDPPVEKIVADLNYIADNYANQRAYFRIGGRPVIFVYATGGDKEGMVQRWLAAREQAKVRFHVVLKLFTGYKESALQPDGWHQYGPSSRYHEHAPYAAAVSPGFWHDDDATPTLGRDPAAFRSAVQQMVAAPATWKLVTTWNEWGEGTGVEPAEQVRTNPASGNDEADPNGVPFRNVYVDTLRELLPPLEAGTGAAAEAGAAHAGAEAAAAPSIAFAAAGDFGFSSASAKSFEAMAHSALDFALIVGDLSYEADRPEQEWCDFVKARVGPTFPVEVLVGNHEDRTVDDDGFIDDFAACLPDRLGSTGIYAHQYFFDYPAAGPLARVILIDADLYRGEARQDYCVEGDTANCDWLKARIDEARAQGLWTIVAVHKNCFTLGAKPCEIGAELVSVLAEKKVDLVIQGHDHGYQRSKQLALGPRCPALVEGKADAACVVDDGADGHYTRGAGMVWVISAAGGVGSNDMDPGDPDAPYVAAWMDKATSSSGWLKVTLDAERLDAQWVGARGSFSDAFSIGKKAAPCPALPTAGGVTAMNVTVAQPGDYRVWSRMAAGLPVGNSYWLQVDDNCPVEVRATAAPGAWQWLNFAQGNSGEVIAVQLNGGKHTITAGSSVPGAKLDKLLLTTSADCTPTSVSGSECVGEAPPYDPGRPPAVVPPCDTKLCTFLPVVTDR